MYIRSGTCTQLIQCREYRFAVKASTCNNLPSNFKACVVTAKGPEHHMGFSYKLFPPCILLYSMQ
jgi:hypothetical protein